MEKVGVGEVYQPLPGPPPPGCPPPPPIPVPTLADAVAVVREEPPERVPSALMPHQVVPPLTLTPLLTV